MKQTIYVEFISDDVFFDSDFREKINNLVSPQFTKITEFRIANLLVITGNIDSSYATAIKLQDLFLSSRMKLYYIDDKLKDKYRQVNTV
jgi:hypothetical protein